MSKPPEHACILLTIEIESLPNVCGVRVHWTADTTLPKCAAHCMVCETNGEGKCDAGNCYPGYAFDAATLTCNGQ